MTETPSAYDILQDNQISGLQELVTPYYQPPGDQEYSFPVVGQGISSQQFQQISRSAGTGVFIPHNEQESHQPYRLHNMPGGTSETNSTNSMMLRTSSVTGRSEASIEGFFHTQLEDMRIEFPPVTTPTTYYLCLTYDPRREEEPPGPIRIEVHNNSLPTTHGRKHIVLWTVERQPNQLLSDARITRTRQWHSPVISVLWHDNLPNPNTTEYGTVAVVHNSYREGEVDPSLYVNQGPGGWHPIVEATGKWTECRPANGWIHSSTPLEARRTPMGIQLRGTLNGESATSSSMARLPAGFPFPTQEYRFHVTHLSNTASTVTRVGNISGDYGLINAWSSLSGYSRYPRFDNVIIPYN